MLTRRSRRFAFLLGLAGVAVLALSPVADAKRRAADTKSPSKPGNFHMTASTATSISLDWNASSDNVGVTGYRVFRNGSLAATVTATQATVGNLACSTIYIMMVSAKDAAGNKSLPAVIFAKTKPCAPIVPRCATPETVFALLLEHKIEYGCAWPDGWAARQALVSVRGFLAGRKVKVDHNWRAVKWMNEVLRELDTATGTSSAWSAHGTLLANAAGHRVQLRVGRAIRLLHWANQLLFEVSKSEKWALTAVSWYMAASEFNMRYRAGLLSPYVDGRARFDLGRADSDFFAGNVYRAWGRYLDAWELVTGVR